MSIEIGPVLPLDPSLYSLQGEELAFIQKFTGINGEDELKNHIIEVQSKAYAKCGYPCIRGFGFLKLGISRNPDYKSALKLLQERQSPILLDLGCCFGTDIRKVVDDGWLAENVVAADLQQDFWDAGHELFKSTPKSFPAKFILGDAFDSGFLNPVSLEDLKAQVLEFESLDHPQLAELTSLTQLRGKVSAIHTASFFHLFTEQRQAGLARSLAALLIPTPGSIILGQHIATPDVGIKRYNRAGKAREMFCHSPSSWEKLWCDDVFGAAGIKTKVTAELVDISDMRKYLEEDGDKVWIMKWSVVLM
ncbi:hypothetical protein CPB83DRAFT_577582 [Crepidotus variabilis]|uniref:Methyltransferase domain-containing protein n=1 Tax=Crepidotus variabilis TaxID=179855 RepID=A0A9P6E9H8_9AGAR|nr:hypothetical protein CPB83DRAFT_577582 [Crepidotus variabilis]